MTTHSPYGGSKIGIIEKCNGYVNATKDCPNETTESAEKGTAYHECAEYCERLGFDAADVKGVEFNGYECDDDMVEAVQLYLNHTRSLKTKHINCKRWVEAKITLSSIADDVFGSADFMLFAPEEKTLYVTDLKSGFLVVDAEGLQNPFYAIGALDTFKLWFQVDKVVCTIVQPRIDHAEGKIRSRTYSIEEIYTFRDRIAEAVRKARCKDAKRTPGSHCTYCSASPTCRPRMERTVFLSTLIGTKADLTNEEIAAVLAESTTITKNLEKMREYANTLARGGSSFEGFKLVKPILRAVCINEDALIADALKNNPELDKSKLFNPGRLKGKTVLKPIVGGDLVNKYFETPKGNAELVPLSNPRPAVNNDASGIFSPIKE